MDIIAALRESNLVFAEEAASAMEQGWTSNFYREASLAELESVYAIRYEHLLANQAPHAQQLAASVREFLVGLRRCAEPLGQWVELRGEAEHHFMVFIAADKAIGCVRQVSQLDVSDARWLELWQGAA